VASRGNARGRHFSGPSSIPGTQRRVEPLDPPKRGSVKADAPLLDLIDLIDLIDVADPIVNGVNQVNKVIISATLALAIKALRPGFVFSCGFW
jgi:hypothetical protein